MVLKCHPPHKLHSFSQELMAELFHNTNLKRFKLSKNILAAIILNARGWIPEFSITLKWRIKLFRNWMKWKALDQIFIIIFKSQCELNLKTEETVIFGFPKIRVCVLPEYLTQTLSNAFLSINSDQRYEFTRASLFICSLQTCTTAVPCMHPGPGKGSRR